MGTEKEEVVKVFGFDQFEMFTTHFNEDKAWTNRIINRIQQATKIIRYIKQGRKQLYKKKIYSKISIK